MTCRKHGGHDGFATKESCYDCWLQERADQQTKGAEMPIIRNKQDWWNAVDEHWPQLRKIFYQFLPMTGYSDIQGVALMNPLSELVALLRETRNDDLHVYFQAAWSAAPDSPKIHYIPGWYVLCDLCSESYVLGEE